jgi:hypothetical protein
MLIKNLLLCLFLLNTNGSSLFSQSISDANQLLLQALTNRLIKKKLRLFLTVTMVWVIFTLRWIILIQQDIISPTPKV